MIRFFFRFIGIVILAFLTMLAHLFFLNFLSFPFNHVLVFFVALTWFAATASNEVAWIFAIALGYFLELFSPLPFGIELISIITSLFIIRWMLWNVFTSRSLPIILMTHAISLLTYFILLGVYLFFRDFFDHDLVPFFLFQFLIGVIWSFFLTSCLLALWYRLAAPLVRRLNPSYVRQERFLV